MEIIKTIFYKTALGKEPLTEWTNSLELKTQVIISVRLTRVRSGNFGTCTSIKGYAGLWEIVINYGPGYRIYYGKQGATTLILLWGGEKKSQKRDIEKAYHYWRDHRETKS